MYNLLRNILSPNPKCVMMTMKKVEGLSESYSYDSWIRTVGQLLTCVCKLIGNIWYPNLVCVMMIMVEVDLFINGYAGEQFETNSCRVCFLRWFIIN